IWQAGTGTSFTLGNGSHTYAVRQTDAAGNVSSASSTKTYVLDTAAAAPSLALVNDTGASSTDGITSNAQVSVSGLENNATWEYQVDGGAWQAGAGTSFTLANGGHTYAVRQTDAAGNVSTASAPVTYVLDTAAVAPSLALANDTGTSGTDGITSNAQVNVSGLETNATWEYQVDGGIWQAGTGTSFTLGNGSHTYAVRQTDAAGNVSSASSTKTYVLDTAAAAPSLALANDTGASSTDGITNNAMVNVNGLETNATWQYQVDGGIWQTRTGTSFTLGNGSHTYAVRQTDLAGNVSSASSTKTYELDQIPPPNSFSVATVVTLSESQKDLLVTGSAEGGASITLIFNGYTFNTTADAVGAWSLTLPPETLVRGGATKVPMTVTAGDLAGNIYTIYQDVNLVQTVNSYLTSDQMHSSATAMADGGWVVTWQSLNQDGSGYGVYQQRYSSAGKATGSETRVNINTLSDQLNPSVTALADGGWVVTWQSLNQDGSGFGVYQQRYSSAGNVAASAIIVNTYTPGEQSYPAVTALADGGWVVTWQSKGQEAGGFNIYQQRYDRTGVMVGGEVRVNTYIPNDQTDPSITALIDGGWVVSWSSVLQDGGGGYNGVYQQRYDSLGAVVGGETRVNTYVPFGQQASSVTALADGGWVVTWESSGQDDSGFGIYQQRYDKLGAAVMGETRVNTTTDDDQFYASVTALADGGWVVTWLGGNAIYQQSYDKVGTALGGETIVGNASADGQPFVTALADGGWVVSWTTPDAGLITNGGFNIAQQRYDSAGHAVEGTAYVLNGSALAALHGNSSVAGYHGIAGSVDSLHIAGGGGELDLGIVAAKSVADPGGVLRVTSIERIDLTGSGDNTLKLSVNDVLGVSDTDRFTAAKGWAGITASAGTHQMLIDGNAGDTVVSTGWTNSGQLLSGGGHTYVVYNASVGADMAQLLIDINVNRTGVTA
ncbi:Ig-like domain-containing protein, partial [Pseudomonas sp. 3296]|uniref:beta strand repeat-containing protein n=1 Tax=Pseudomonas sp. 3296 TaxID=2817753 RepID=UPI00286CD5B2